MAGYKLLKRKGVDQFSDDFSDFSLSSPATKIRRLDAELPPIAEVEVEEEELPPLPLSVTQEAPNPNPNPNPIPNEERALVLFKPLPHSPSSSFSLSLHSDLISGIKDWSKQCDSDCDRLVRSQRQEEEEDRNNNQRLALVPWVPSSYSQFPHAVHDSNNTTNTELMMEADAEEMGGEGEEAASMMMMDIEQQEDPTTNSNDSSTTTIHPINPTSTPPLNLHHRAIGMGTGVGGGITTTAPEGFHQWQQQQQQHCLLPQFPQNTSTPITWTR